MNFFKLYIGDYQRDTAHLSVTEHGAYLLMLQHYYATEKPLPVGKALHRMLRADSKAEKDAADLIVRQFWTASEDGLVNARADEELSKAAENEEGTEQRRANERERQRRARERRRLLYEQLRGVNVTPPFDATTAELEALVTRHVTRDITANHSHSHSQSKEEEKNPPTPRKRGSVSGFPPGFDAFWSAYPRKVGKDAAAKAFSRRRFTSEQVAVVVASIDAQRNTGAWTKDGGRFIPHPSTWLNEGRWQDEIGSKADPFAGAM